MVAKEKAKGLRSIFSTISDVPGIITPGTPRTGIYVLPDNIRVGTLDTILLECASVIYPDHKAGATEFISKLPEVHKKGLTNPFKEQKAIVACIVSVLKPGAANTSSIAQDKWLSEESIKSVRDVVSLYRFICDLVELPRV